MRPFDCFFVSLIASVPVLAQGAPVAPEHVWHSPRERQIAGEAQRTDRPKFSVDSGKVYSLPELTDPAEAHNPETRVAWESARAQGAALGIARSELFPALSAAAMSGVDRQEIPIGGRFYRLALPEFPVMLNFSYTVFDFGACRGRIDAAGARVLAANFGFNDVHRKVIYEVQQAYYRLLNASGQEGAARASLANAEAVQQAAEERLKLEAGVAAIREANAEEKEARAAYYPILTLQANPTVASLFVQQQNLPWGHTADLTGGVALQLNWSVFDGGARKNRVAQADAQIHRAEARVSASRDAIEDEVWTAYSDLNTAFRQREATTALLDAACQSYAAALESYNCGVRNLLDVTAAQKALAQARSSDILARTQVLAALSDLAFRAADSIQAGHRRP